MVNNEQSERWHSSGEQLVMEGYAGYHGMLIDIKTGKDRKTEKKYKKEMIKQIREQFGRFFESKKFEELKKDPLDLAIYLEVNAQRLSKQDLDNVLKVVLDALQKDGHNPSWNYLYENDSQVYRLHVEKSEKVEIPGYNTASMMISFRKHDPSKQITMVPYQGDFARKFGFM